MTPTDAALELIDHLEAGQPLPEDLTAWLLRGFKLCRAGHVKSIDEALGLRVERGRAAEALHNVWRTQERNRLIREIASLLDLPRTKAALVMAEAMQYAVPDVESREVEILLIKLRNLTQGTGLALKRSRVLEVMAGHGQ